MSIHMPILARLSNKFTVGDECWEWTSSRNNRGYGMFYLYRRQQLAHRVMYELMVGPIPVGLQIDHLCRNKGCVRPSHLEPVTGKVNKERATKDRCIRGHPYTPDNLILQHGRRRCRACHYAANNRRYHAEQARRVG